MRIHRDHVSLPAAARGTSVAIGNFDGVHRGHREVIRMAAAHASTLGRPLGVVTFEPHPREVLTPTSAPPRLTPLRRKAEILRGLGVDHLFVFRFDQRLMHVPAADFVTEVLLGQLKAAAITTGRDFRFGYKRQGDTDLLAALAASRVPVTAVDPVTVNGHACSSTAIRAALSDGLIERANALLGYDYELEGIVRPGDQLGRTIGFPTANLHPLGRRPVLPATGVYAVTAGLRRGGATSWLPAVAYFGTRPTFDGRSLLLEVHLLDGGGDLYGQRLRVAFTRQLRGDRRFAGIDELKAQIARDCEQARAVHAPIPA
jgi:riboflavin kinase/FMN adenylyltransferase